MKNRKKFIVFIVAIFSLLIATNVNAVVIVPQNAKPILKSGQVLGSNDTDQVSSGRVTNKNGISAVGLSSYSSNGDFAFGIGYHGQHSAYVAYLNNDGSLKQVISPTRGSVRDAQSEVTAIITDAEGNFYIGGYDYSGRQSGITGVGTYTFTAQGSANAFILKTDADGNILWYNVIDGNQVERVNGLGFDDSGNILVSGFTNSTTGNFTGTLNGPFDLFISKLNSNTGAIMINPVLIGGDGTETQGTTSLDGVFTIRQDIIAKNGFIYLPFHTNSSVGGMITEKASTGTDYDLGLIKLDQNLNVVSYKSFGGNGDDTAHQAILTSSGNLFFITQSTSTDLQAELLETKGEKDIKYLELDLDMNYINGGVIGGTGIDQIYGYNLLPSGDIVVSGSTTSIDGDFSDRTATSPTGFAAYLDTNNHVLRNTLYYADSLSTVSTKANGDFVVTGMYSDITKLGTVNGTFKGDSDIVMAIFGPTSGTQTYTNSKDVVNILVGSSNTDSKKLLNPHIGDHDGFVSQNTLTLTPNTIPNTIAKSYAVEVASPGALTKTSYVNVTANPNPTVKGVQVFDSAAQIRILLESELTADKLTSQAKIKAWNMTDNSIYTHTIDATDLAAVNAATASTTVPVKVTITEVTRANLTRTTNVILMTKAEMEALIKAEAEDKWGPDQTELAKIAVQVVGLGIKNADEIINEISTNTGTAQKYKEDLDKLTVNVDTDGDGTADYNIDIDGDGTADVNKDTNRDGTPNENLVQTTDPKGNNYDKDGDGYPDTNTDKDGDGKPDLNIDYEGDGIADFNKDANRDGAVDVPNGNAVQTTDPKAPNYDKDGDGKPDNNIDKDGDGKPELNIDYDGNGTADHNKDANKDGVVDTPSGNAIQTNDPNGLNYDKDGDGKADTNVDIDGDKKPDVNIDYDGDGNADFNKDTNKDGVVDTPNGNAIQTTDPKAPNYDKDGDGKADNNIDKDGDGKIDFNLDIDGDGTADINKDANKDAVVDTPDGNPTQNTDPKGNNYDKDDDGYPDLNTDVNGDKKPDLNIDYDGNGTADQNKDANRDGVVDTPNGNAIQTTDPNGLNYDKDGDGKADTNVDIDGDKKPDVNIDYDGDGIADFNKDTNKDGVVDTPNGNAIQTTDPKAPNYDKDGDGKADNNIDKDGDGKIDFNLDIDGDGTADINKDANKDAVVDTPDGNPTQNTDPNGNNYDKDDDGYPDLNTDIDGDKKPDLNIDTDKDGKPNLNIDADKDGKAELNIDTDGNGKPNVNIDIDGNGTADVNKDTNGDGKADANKTQTTDPNGNNYDKDGDEYPDTNIDIDDDGKPDLNIDYDGDGIADHNKDADGDGKVDKPGGNEVQNKDPYAPNYDKDGDGKADNNIDKDGDGKIDFNLDIDGDGTADVNKDADKDGVVDVPGGNPTQNKDPEGNNYDKDGDGYPELNVDIDGDKKPDLNIDTDKDGKPNLNIDADKDGKPELNVDTDGNGKANVNIDIDGNGTADINKDTNGDGKADTNKTQTTDPKAPNYDEDGDEYPDTNIDIDGDGKIDLNRDIDGDKKPDLNIDTDGDGKADKNIDANNNGIIDSVEDAANKLPNTGNDTVAIISVLITLSGVLYIQRFKSDV